MCKAIANRLLMRVTVVLAACANGTVAAEDELEDVIARTTAATRGAQEAIPIAIGEGKFLYKVTRRVDGKEEVRLHERGPFTAAYSGKLDFLKFTYEESDPKPEYDAKVYVNDGKGLWMSVFSPRVLPHGAEGEIWRLLDESHGESLFCILPHAFPEVWTAIDRWRTRSPGSTIKLTEENDRLVVVITEVIADEAWRSKFFIDPMRNHHVVEYQIVMPNGKPINRLEKHWAQTEDQLWYVQKFVREALPRNEGSSHSIWSMEFTSFTPNVDLPAALFTPDALALPAGARIIDRRRPENDLEAAPPKVERTLLEAVVGPLPKPRPDDLKRRAAD